MVQMAIVIIDERIPIGEFLRFQGKLTWFICCFFKHLIQQNAYRFKRKITKPQDRFHNAHLVLLVINLIHMFLNLKCFIISLLTLTYVALVCLVSEARKSFLISPFSASLKGRLFSLKRTKIFDKVNIYNLRPEVFGTQFVFTFEILVHI